MQGAQDQDEAKYIQYRPTRVVRGHEHPDLIVESASLASVDPPKITCDLSFMHVRFPQSIMSAIQVVTDNMPGLAEQRS